MPAVTIRNLPNATHRALKLRAERNGRSTEAELRAIIEDAVRPPSRILIGSALAAAAREAGLTNEDVDELLASRDRTPAEPMSFE